MNDSLSCKCSPPVDVTDGRVACPEFWIAAYTRPKSEKKAAAELAKTPGIVTYAPTQTIVRQWSDRRKKVEVVVIPMVIFARVTSEARIAEIIRHPLIHKLVTNPGEKAPAHIPAWQIEQLRLMLDKADGQVEFVKGGLKVADAVRVVRGQFAGLEGVVQRASDGHTYITITIDLLGGAKVSVNPSDLELISKQL